MPVSVAIANYGEKTHEYREFKPYWNKRINKLKKGDVIVFCKGYPQYG